MKLFARWWSVVVHAFEILTFQEWSGQHPLESPLGHSPALEHLTDSPLILRPPNASPGFTCDYTAMGPDWTSCFGQNRSCWLQNQTYKYDIGTDYERWMPQGKVRKYSLDVSDLPISPDGYLNPNGQVFNGNYPGPWIEGCWGDTLEITVTNKLKWNGTTIHWHGIRQLGSNEMDGVNGVTQCPIAPGKSFTYVFNLTQYGTSWYHSHYSLQYANGLAGPMTIYGPASVNDYDEAIAPILMTDWNHRGAFADFYSEITPGQGPPNMTNILVNGKGTWECSPDEIKRKVCTPNSQIYNLTFKKGKKYLLRLINTAVDTTFIFAIDNHRITVIGSDFVPIEPYTTDSVLVGIGQRYHVIVEAKPVDDPRPPKAQNYWIRTIPADGCGRFKSPPNETTGVLYYETSDRSISPDTKRGKFPTKCSDEPYDKLKPIVKWQAGRPSNEQEKATFQAGIHEGAGPNGLPPGQRFSRWELGPQSMWLDFSRPTILDLRTKKKNWDPNLVVVPLNNTIYRDSSWIYLLVMSTGYPFGTASRNFVPAAHPIHLHGHDFLILEQSDKPYWSGQTRFKFDNPPRRDVALLPANGYLVLAYRADNPGVWLVHCHIAWHASAGLALQIIERENDTSISDSSQKAALGMCKDWNQWYANKNNWWEKGALHEFQDDSGI